MAFGFPFGFPGRRGGMMRRYGLRAVVLAILKKQPMTGAEIMDSIQEMTMGWWRPSPGSIYPLLSDLVEQGYLTKSDTGRYALTSKAQEEINMGWAPGFTGPIKVEDMIKEISSYLDYFSDLAKRDQAFLREYGEKLKQIHMKLGDLVTSTP